MAYKHQNKNLSCTNMRTSKQERNRIFVSIGDHDLFHMYNYWYRCITLATLRLPLNSYTMPCLRSSVLTREGRGEERRKFVVTWIGKEINLYGADYYAAVA